MVVAMAWMSNGVILRMKKAGKTSKSLLSLCLVSGVAFGFVFSPEGRSRRVPLELMEGAAGEGRIPVKKMVIDNVSEAEKTLLHDVGRAIDEADRDSGTMAQLLASFRRLPMADRTVALQWLFLRWAEFDPASALEAAEGLEDFDLWGWMIHRVWAQQDVIGAMAANSSSLRQANSGWVQFQWAREINEENVDDVYAAVMENKKLYLNHRMWEAVNRELHAGGESFSDLAESLSVLAVDQRFSAISGLAAAWAAVDFDGMKSWMQTLEIEEYRAAITPMVSSLGRHDRDALGAMLLEKSIQRQDLSVFLPVLAEGPVDDAVDWLTKYGALKEARSVARAYFRRDPEQAFAFLRALPSEQQFTVGARILDQAALFAKPEALLTWAEGLSNEEERASALAQIRNRALAMYPGEGLNELVGRLPEGALKASLAQMAGWEAAFREGNFEEMADWLDAVRKEPFTGYDHHEHVEVTLNRLLQDRWSGGGTSAVAALIESVPDEALGRDLVRRWVLEAPESVLDWVGHDERWSAARDEAVSCGLQELARRSPDEAIAWLREVAPEWARAPEMMAQLADGWVGGGDPAGAAAWSGSLSEEATRVQVMQAVSTRWSSYNSGDVAQWAFMLSPSPERDAVVLGMLDSLAWEDLSAAASWALTLREPEARRGAVVRLLEKHGDRLAEVQSAIASSSLGAEEQAGLLLELEGDSS